MLRKKNLREVTKLNVLSMVNNGSNSYLIPWSKQYFKLFFAGFYRY